jgi:iron complex outermembrane recepter protein
MKQNLKILTCLLLISGFSLFGQEKTKDTIKNQNLDEVVIIGSRNASRTKTESAVPIDVISMKEIATQGAQANLNQILNMVAPSFTSNTQTVADGTDHIDPAQLRGLGPDQVLVLLNGKRRHTSSLVNINGTPGRGAVGTDLNAIPAFAIDRIEVLRDGASAQYGSDAIAGVINLNLKKATNKLEINAIAGSNFSSAANNHRGGHDGNNYQFDANYGRKIGKDNKGFINFTASLQLRDATSRANDENNTIFNGFNSVERVAAANGVNLTTMFGNINNIQAPFTLSGILTTINTYAPQAGFSAAKLSAINTAAITNSLSGMQAALNFDTTDAELAIRGLERKDFNMRVGQSSLQSTQFFVNSMLPINDKLNFYMFGGAAFRTGASAGFYRKPNQSRAFTGLYPNGFLPEIHSSISDGSFAAGLKGTLYGNWKFDFSNSIGQNRFGYSIENTSNATLRQKSKSAFNAGYLGFLQNTTNFDVVRKFEKLNVALGAEYRYENFEIKAGEPDSYNKYDINGNVFSGLPSDALLQVTDFFGNIRPNGSQVFPGYRPYNEVDKTRNSKAVYGDLEYDISEKWLVNGAVRHENYSDFGKTTNYKIASMFKVTPTINLRGAYATGFRAPSLHQIYFSSTATQFVGGVPFEVGTFNHDQSPTKILGIPDLKQEESQSTSFGFTAKIPDAKITITADAYMINIKDRVVLTDQFARPTGVFAPGTANSDLQIAFDASGATAAAFFANAIDTQSKGIDIVVTHKMNIGAITLKSDLSATFSNTKRVGDIHASSKLEAAGQVNRYYSETSRIYLEEAIPRVKANLTNTINFKKIEFFLRNVYFGQVTDPNTADVNGDGIVTGEIINGSVVETEHPIWGAKVITDFSAGFSVTKNIKLVVGANNLLDIYPDGNLGKQLAIKPRLVAGAIDYTATPTLIDLANNNQFAYSRNVSQFGQNGRFVFARLSMNF